MKEIIKQAIEPSCLTEFKQNVNYENEKGKGNIEFLPIKLDYETFSTSKDYKANFTDFRNFGCGLNCMIAIIN